MSKHILLSAKTLIAVFLFLLTPSISSGNDSPDSGPLTSIQRIAELGNHATGRRVDLTAVLTFVDLHFQDYIIQQEEHAIQIGRLGLPKLTAGELVRVTGTVKQGKFGAYIVMETSERLGKSSLPVPVNVDLASRSLDDANDRYSVVRGEVIQAICSDNHTTLACRAGEQVFYVSQPRLLDVDQMNRLLYRQFEFTGCLGLENDILMSPSPIAFRINCNRLPNPLEEPQSPIPSRQIGQVVNQQLNVGEIGSRILIEGQIISEKEGEHFILDAGGTPIRLETHTGVGIGIGHLVQVVGLVQQTPTGHRRIMAEIVHSQQTLGLPSPNEATVAKALQTQRVSERLRVRGRPENVLIQNGILTFDLVDSQKRKLAVSYIDVMNRWDEMASSLNNASVAEVTGVVQSPVGDGPYRIHSQLPGEVFVVEERKSYKTYFTWATAALVGVAAVGFTWISTLKRQVNVQTKDLDQTNASLISTYEAIADGVVAVNLDGLVIAVNSGFQTMTGLQYRIGEKHSLEADLKSLGSYVSTPDEYSATLDRLTESPDCRGSIEFEITHPQARHVQLNIAPVVSETTNRVFAKLFVFRDLTKEKKLQADLTHAHKLEAVGQTVSSVAHEFNNMLTAVITNLSIIKLKDPDYEHLSFVEDAERAADRGAKIVRRLLTYAGKTKDCSDAYSVNELIRRFHSLTRHTFDARIDFRFHLDRDDPICIIDPTVFEQVLMNLYLNARDALPEGGAITTSTQRCDKNQQVMICIEDLGMGIRPEDQSRIFDPFFTTKANDAGTGLGLPTSAELIERYDGTLVYQPNNPTGSKFIITLPLSDLPASRHSNGAAPVSSSVQQTDANLNGMHTVLVVDDDDAVRKGATAVLQSHGFDVLTAVNGRAGLAVLETEHPRVDLVLLDLTMPGIPGEKVLQEIRQKYPRMSVVVCSGYFAEHSDFQQGTTRRLSKPYSSELLLDTVKTVIGENKPTTS